MSLPTITLLCCIIWHLILYGELVKGKMVTFHIRNKCTFTVWPASAPNAGHPVIGNGGFTLASGLTKIVEAPQTWNGRFWARTGCNFSSNSTKTDGPACQTGDCEGGLECNGTIGLPPATLVEIALLKNEPTYYDVSLVDGYNIPVSVSSKPSNPNCTISGCTKSINTECPKELQVLDHDNKTIACKSACLAFNKDSFCCRNEYATPETCEANSYSKMFKKACPHYVSFPFDSPSPLKKCCSCEFVITFCPSKWSIPSSEKKNKQVWSY